MISVSNEFKTAIKKPERRIKGYVEVLYDVANIISLPTTDITSTYTTTNQIIKEPRVSNLYGSLDYLPLDGTQLTMSDNPVKNKDSGYISDELFQDIESAEISFQFGGNAKRIEGITIYSRANIPTSVTVSLDNSYSKTVSNDSETLQIFFEEPKLAYNIVITINDMMYQDRKIYINKIDFGISQVYKDQDLIEFTVDEEVNKLVEEVPINETNVILNNMSDLFNPLNPSGIVPYLSENTLIKPYIGVLTETSGVEYVKMGEFYFDSYTNNSDATTTLVGKNIIKRVEAETIKDDNESTLLHIMFNESRFTSFMNNYNYVFNSLNWQRSATSMGWKSLNLIDLLKDLAFWQANLFYANRDNKLNLMPVNSTPQETLTKNELINDAQYKAIDKINTIYYVRNVETSGSSTKTLEQTVTLTKSPEYFTFVSDTPCLVSSISQSGGSSATLVNGGFYINFVKVTGTVGNDVTITMSGGESSISTRTESVTNRETEKEVALTFDSPLATAYALNNDVLSKTPSYEMSLEYNGDPSLEAGDYINVETPYGYKPLFIQKNRFKFDGGLEGTIEGVE